MAHNEHMSNVDWDGWLDRLIRDENIRKVVDIRADLIAEIRRAISESYALGTGDTDQLAEIAVDTMIAFGRKHQIRPI